MNAERKTLADLFARLHGMGVESADLTCRRCGATGRNKRVGDECYMCEGAGSLAPSSGHVLMVLGEMMNVATPGITMSDVLNAAKKAGVY